MAKPTMNVSLTTELERFVQSQVESGLYGNQSEVVRAALRLLMREQITAHRQLQEVREALAVGMEDILAGRTLSAEEARAEMAAYMDERERNLAKVAEERTAS